MNPRLRKLLGATALCVLASTGEAALISTFDGGADGWSVDSSQGAEGVADFFWDGEGGFVQATDIGNQGGWWFVAPASWQGDWTPFLGGSISFDVYAKAGQDTVLNPPFEAIVLQLADGGRLRAIAGAGAVLDQWVSVRIDLTAASFLLTNSSYASFEEALMHVTGMVIPTDFVFKQLDSTLLDNVRVGAMTVPEPGTALLLLAASIALPLLARARRRPRCAP